MKSKKPRVAVDPRRLTGLERGSYASVRAIQRILDDVAENGIPDAHSRSTMFCARKIEASKPTPFGKLVQRCTLPLEGHKPLEIGVQHPMAMLYTACTECPSFKALLLEKLAANPAGRPFRWVMYCD